MELKQYYLDAAWDPQRNFFLNRSNMMELHDYYRDVEKTGAYWTPSAEIFLRKNCQTMFPQGRVLCYDPHFFNPNLTTQPDFIFLFQRLDFNCNIFQDMDFGNNASDVCARCAVYISVTQDDLPTADMPISLCINGLLKYFDCIPQRLYFFWEKSLAGTTF